MLSKSPSRLVAGHLFGTLTSTAAALDLFGIWKKETAVCEFFKGFHTLEGSKYPRIKSQDSRLRGNDKFSDFEFRGPQRPGGYSRGNRAELQDYTATDQAIHCKLDIVDWRTAFSVQRGAHGKRNHE